MKEATFKSATSSRLRIADVLLMDEEEEEAGFQVVEGSDGGGCMGVVSRCLSRLKRTKGKRVSVENGKCSTNSLNEGDMERSDRSGECRREASFNLGVGCYLLHLIALSKKELEKMTELQTQMETLLRNVKEELQKKDALVNPCESNGIYAYSTPDVIEGLKSNDHNSLLNWTTSHVSPGSSSSTIKVCDRSLMCNGPKPEGMDQLEAELEAELERLQFHLDGEELLQHIELKRVEETVKDTASASQSLSSGEVIDPVIDNQEAYAEVECGVSPHELERRLHEVLEARQQEQIRELEAALECARYKLREKEMEISWWKDTARLTSKHVARPPRIISEFSIEP